MNQGTIAGHLGADPEVRFTSSGQKVTTFRLAARVRKGGKDETIWWRVTVWGEAFDKMIPYFKKGSSIIVVGEMNKPEIFTDRDGRPQVSMSITAFNLLFSPFGKPDSSGSHSDHAEEKKESSPEGGQEQLAYGQAFGGSAGQGQKGNSSFSDDEVPF